jgi:hypothetical protein
MNHRTGNNVNNNNTRKIRDDNFDDDDKVVLLRQKYSKRSRIKQRQLLLTTQAANRCLLGNGCNPNLPPLPVLKRLGAMETTFQHPYGVLPYGNIYTEDTTSTTADSVRRRGLGVISIFNDDQILSILSFLDGTSLSMVTSCSRFLYVAAHQTELWRDLTLQEYNKNINSVIDFFEGTWKDMFVRINKTSRRRRLPNGNSDSVTSTTENKKYCQHKPIHVHGVYSDTFYRSYLCRSFAFDPSWLDQGNNNSTNVVSREDVSTLDIDTFIGKYEQPNIPVIIENATQSWPALQKWTATDYLIQTTIGSSYRATSGSAPYPAQFSMKAYIQYCDSSAAQTDEAPLYLFDRSFAIQTPELYQDYFPALQKSCPYLSSTSHDGHDLFRLLGQDSDDDTRRPDYKWIIVGPQRSGSNFHIDPNATHAWNAPIRGRKFWILYPPGVPPPGVIPSTDGDEVMMPISVGEWFLSFWSQHVQQRSTNPDRTKRPLECLVSPGELLFVPHGWWHLVYNIDDGVSVALTHNYVSSTNLSTVLRFLKKKQSQISGCRDRTSAIPPEKLYEEFSSALKLHRPDLWENAYPLSEQGWTCPAWTDDDNNDHNNKKVTSDRKYYQHKKDHSDNTTLPQRNSIRKSADESTSTANTTNKSCSMSVISRAKSNLGMSNGTSVPNQEEADNGNKTIFSFSFVQ